MREIGATLAVAVTALGGVGGAAAAVDSTGGQASAQPPAVEATVDTSQMAAAVEAGYGVRGGPSDVAEPPSQMAAAVEAGYGVRGGPSDVAEPPSQMAAAVEAGYGVRGRPSDVAEPPSQMAAAVEAGYGVRGRPSDVAEPPSQMAAAVEAGYGVRGGPSDVAEPSVPDGRSRGGGLRGARRAERRGRSKRGFHLRTKRRCNGCTCRRCGPHHRSGSVCASAQA